MKGWFRTAQEVHQPNNISTTYDKDHVSRQQSHEPPFHRGHHKASIHLLHREGGIILYMDLHLSVPNPEHWDQQGLGSSVLHQPHGAEKLLWTWPGDSSCSRNMQCQH